MITVKELDSVMGCDIYITGTESVKNFKVMVARALNVWPNAPAELKEFGDMLQFGEILQDYRTQNQPMTHSKEPQNVVLTNDELPKCSRCGGMGYHHLHNCEVLVNTK